MVLNDKDIKYMISLFFPEFNSKLSEVYGEDWYERFKELSKQLLTDFLTGDYD